MTPPRPTEERLLTRLLDADGGFVPGQELQELLGISRPAIWKWVEKLGSQGIRIEAKRHYGYRFAGEPEALNALLLRAYRPLVLHCPEICFYDEVDSTNSVAERLIAEGRQTPFVVIAARQTAGRGRRGREWHSPSAGGLQASFAFRPERAPRDMPAITLWLGLAIARHLRDRLQLPVFVKWPNDLLLRGKKLAGMLTEARIDADHIRDLVFGLGLNLFADPDAWPDAVRAVATTVREHLPPALAISWHRLVAELLGVTVGAYKTYLQGPVGAEMQRLWPSFDALAGRRVTVRGGAFPLTGTAIGIDDASRLLIRLPDGQERAVNAGEVTLGSGDGEGTAGQSR